jgi:hypothetical protein
MSRAAVLLLHPCRMTADAVLSAACLAALVAIWRRTKYGLFDPYRPELHYMRGPGPKWREKHGVVFPTNGGPITRPRPQT